MDKSAKFTSLAWRLSLVVVITVFVQLVRCTGAPKVVKPGPTVLPAVPPASARAVAPRGRGADPAPIPQPAPASAMANPIWIVTERAIGPILFDMTVDSARKVLNPYFSVARDAPGCDRVVWPMLPPGVILAIEGDRVVGTFIRAKDIETSQHVRVGMTEADVRRAYPSSNNAVHVEGFPPVFELVVTSPDQSAYQLRFVIDHGILMMYRAGNWDAMTHWQRC